MPRVLRKQSFYLSPLFASQPWMTLLTHYSVITCHIIVAIYSSAHSSRSGTANGGYSHQPSPISMSHSMASSPMAPMSHSPYPVQHSPMSARMQPSPGPQMQQAANHPTMVQHSPLPAATELTQPQLLHQHSSVDFRWVVCCHQILLLTWFIRHKIVTFTKGYSLWL